MISHTTECYDHRNYIDHKRTAFHMAHSTFTEPFLDRLQKVIESDPDLTTAGLAVKAGLNNAAIRQWFSRENASPTFASARKVCAALGTTLEVFMSNAQTEEEQEIVHLLSQLDVASRRELLGYGKALASRQDPALTTNDATEE